MRTLSVIRSNRGFIWFTVILFIVGVLLGAAFPDALDQILKSQLEHIKNIASEAKGNSSKLASMIFFNNLRVSISLIVAGIFFSIFPVCAIALNGMVIGYLFARMGAAGGLSILAMLLFGIVPHGLFEIPAFILAGAMGIKLGYMWLRPVVGKTRWRSFLFAGRETLFVTPVIIVLLLAAAMIEGYVTPMLLNWYLK